jgi:hypothetical protein
MSRASLSSVLSSHLDMKQVFSDEEEEKAQDIMRSESLLHRVDSGDEGEEVPDEEKSWFKNLETAEREKITEVKKKMPEKVA